MLDNPHLITVNLTHESLHGAIHFVGPDTQAFAAARAAITHYAGGNMESSLGFCILFNFCPMTRNALRIRITRLCILSFTPSAAFRLASLSERTRRSWSFKLVRYRTNKNKKYTLLTRMSKHLYRPVSQ